MLAVAATAQQNPSFIPVWTGEGQAFTEPALNALMTQCTAKEPRPDHIVVMIHGYDNTQEQSQQLFQEVAPRVSSAFARSNKRVMILGLQWDSAPPGGKTPWKAEEAYMKMVPRARSMGHGPARQLLLRLQKQYPKARMHLLAHSMGCEAAAACALPEMAYTDGLESSPPLQPKKDLMFGLLALCGSDLDYDVWYKTRVNFRNKNPRVRLMWMTISKYVGDVRDKTLVARKVSRGPAGGSAFPRMTEEQYNLLFKGRAAVFDNQDIPPTHHFGLYYSEERVNDLVQAMVFLGDAKAPKPQELVEAEKVLALPNQVSAILPFLDGPTFTGRAYAVWRLESVMCGGPKHMTDGTLENVARLLRNKPREVWDVAKDCPCKMVKAGYWPTDAQMEEAGAPSWAKPK